MERHTLELPKEVTVSVYPPVKEGGQQAGVSTGVKLEDDRYGFIVIVNLHRSQHRNLQIAKDMMLAGLTNPYVN